MKLLILCYMFVFVFCFFSCQKVKSPDENAIKNAITSVLTEQVNGWNEGNIEKYMAGYVVSDSLRYASGGTAFYGWQNTLERYKRAYPDKAAMGALTLSEIHVTIVSDNAALVFGRWELQRAAGDKPGGLFTLLFRKTNAGWRIVHDHTSSAKR